MEGLGGQGSEGAEAGRVWLEEGGCEWREEVGGDRLRVEEGECGSWEGVGRVRREDVDGV